MSKIVRYEFMGNWFLFWVLCVTVVFIPIAVLYLIGATLQLQTEVDDAESFATAYRAGKVKFK